MLGWRTRHSPLSRRDFVEARQSGKRLTGRYFFVLVRERGDGARARLGLTVTRKVGRAVRRNRVKRLVREWFRNDATEVGDCDLIVIAKNDLPPRLTVREVGEDLSRMLSTAGYRVGRSWCASSGPTSGRSRPSSRPPVASTRAARSTRSR